MLYGRLDEHKNVVRAEREDVEALLADVEARKVGYAQIGAAQVFTTFLAINHGTDDDPEWFETMVVTPEYEKVFRYETWEEALAGHMRAAEDVALETKEDGSPKWKA